MPCYLTGNLSASSFSWEFLMLDGASSAPTDMQTGAHMHPGPGDLGGWKDLRVPTPLNSRPDLEAVVSVVVVGNGQDTTSP